MNYYCEGAVARRTDGNIEQTGNLIPKTSGNSVDRHHQQTVDQEAAAQQHESQSQHHQKASAHFSTPLSEGLPSDNKHNLAIDQTPKILCSGASIDRSSGCNISGSDRSNSNVNNVDDNMKTYKLRYGSSVVKIAPTVTPISNLSNISKYQPFYASIPPSIVLDNQLLKNTRAPLR